MFARFRSPVSAMCAVLALVVVLFSPVAWCARIPLDLCKGESSLTGGLKSAGAVLQSVGRPELGVLRRTDLSAGVAQTTKLNVGDVLSLRLFEDVEFELVLTRQTESPLGGRSFLAEATGYDGVKNAVVYETVSGLQIDIQDYRNGRVYTVFSNAKGVVVKEINPSAGKVLPTTPLIPPLANAVPKLSRATLLSATQQSSTCVDMLVAFDRNALAWANAQGGGITNFATMVVQRMNLVLGNTGLDEMFRFRLVGVMAVQAETDNLSTALDAVTEGTGDWSSVKAMRDAVGADLVTTLIDTGSAYGTTGLSWGLRTTDIASFSEYGYSVCSVRSAAQSHVVAHETGHSMGAGHSDRQADSPGPQLYSFSSGFYFKSGSQFYHTIMAYNSDGFSETNYQPVPFFSSPNYAYEGVTVGDATHDNARTLAQTFSAVSNWRRQVVPESYDVFFTPESGTSFKTSLSVTLRPGRDGVEVLYTTDGSDPTTASSRYTGPFSLTQTTTVKACTMINGVLGPVFQATYNKESLGMALNVPQYAWTTGSDCPWEYETTNTYDSVHALVAIVPGGKTAWVKTTVTGPLYGTFCYSLYGNKTFRVLCDDEAVFEQTSNGYNLRFVEESFRIPAGEHELKFELTSRSGTASGFLDEIHFYETFPPEISPNSGTSAPYTFEGTTLVTLSHQNAGAQLFYTLDGTDPTSENAVLYEGPFPVSKSVTVRVCAVVAGAGMSPIVEASFSERHRPKPGEWTTNISGVLDAAATDGRLIAILCANFNGCYYSQRLDPIARGDEFTAWAAANGVYLVSADTGRDADAGEASSKFSSLYSQSALRTVLGDYVYYPTFVLTTPLNSSTCAGAFLARSGYVEENGVDYDYQGTCASLVRFFAAALGETPLGEPVVTMSSETAYPRTVTVQNTNGTGVVYYTLDGSAPTPRNGTRYTVPVSIATPGGKFMAAVWPDAGTRVSSSIVKLDFRSIADLMGTEDIVWQNDANLPWGESSNGWIQGGKDLSLTTGKTTSTLKATLTGAGKLIFDYEVSSLSSMANVALKVNGTILETWKSGNQGTYILDVPGTGTTTVEWIYTYPYYDSYEYLYGRIGNVKWIHLPTCPSGMTASDGTYSNGVFVTWNTVVGATTYRLYRSTSEAFLNPVLVRETEKTFGWDFTAQADKTYWYAVAAVNAYGESAHSAVVSGWRSAPLEIADELLPTAFKTVAYSYRFTARGGKSPYVWQELPLGESYEERREASSFAQTGTAKGWKSDDSAWELELPFSFPFYGKLYSKVYVSSNGTISFGKSFSDYSESVQTLKENVLIAAFWDDLTTSSGDIFVASASDSVTIRWTGTAYSGGGSVNFSATLKSDGTIRLQYGAGNTPRGLIGISAGDGQRYQLSAVSQTGNFANVQDIVFVSDGLPNGFRVSADGVLNGTPTQTGSCRFRVGLADATGNSVSKIYELNVSDSSGFVVVPSEVTGGMTVAVPQTWVADDLAKRFGADRAALFVTKFGNDLAQALLKPTGKKGNDGSDLLVWQDYVAGTDPTDLESKFIACIAIENGVPKVTWMPDLNEGGTKALRTYVVYGAKELGGTWKNMNMVPAAEKADYKFFKVAIEMP